MLPLVRKINVAENKVWFICNQVPLLCYVDLSKKMIYKYTLPSYIKEDSSFIDVIFHNNKLFFLPQSASEILIFDTKEEKFENLPIKEKKNVWWKFCSGVIWRDLLYAIPREDEFVCVDCNTKRIKNALGYNNFKGMHFYKALLRENTLIALPDNRDGILFLNLESGVGEWRFENILSAIDMSREWYEVTFCYNYMFIYNYMKGRIIRLNLNDENDIDEVETKDKNPACFVSFQNKYICLDYYYKNEMVLYDTELKQVFSGSKIKEDKKFETYNGAWYVLGNDQPVWYNNCTGELRVYKDDFMSDKYESVFLELEDEYVYNLLMQRNKGVVNENESIGLNTFLDFALGV